MDQVEQAARGVPVQAASRSFLARPSSAPRRSSVLGSLSSSGEGGWRRDGRVAGGGQSAPPSLVYAGEHDGRDQLAEARVGSARHDRA